MAEEDVQTTKIETLPIDDKWYTPLTRATPLSKYLALALFVVLPFVGFWVGVGYGNRNLGDIAPPVNLKEVDCGVENLRFDGAVPSHGARSCIVEAFHACSPARFQSTHYSLEGGRFISTLRVVRINENECRLWYHMDGSDYWAIGKEVKGWCNRLTTKNVEYVWKGGVMYDAITLEQCDASLEDWMSI